MAKVSFPLFSLNAHGTLAGILTYSTRKIVKQVRYQKPQKDYENLARKVQRDKFRTGCALWNALSPEQKAVWTTLAKDGFIWY